MIFEDFKNCLKRIACKTDGHTDKHMVVFYHFKLPALILPGHLNSSLAAAAGRRVAGLSRWAGGSISSPGPLMGWTWLVFVQVGSCIVRRS